MATELPQIAAVPALPVAVPRERADAARNRERVLEAARAIVEEAGPEGFSMHDVARRAGVGAGTVYRRFGDQRGLIFALLDETDRVFQEEVLSGPPPLGPSAPAAERLRAFGRRYAEVLDSNAPLLCAAGLVAPVLHGPFPSYRAFLRGLLAEAAPGLDADYAVESLMSAVSPPIHLHLRRELGWPLARIQDGWVALVDGWLSSAG